MKKKQYIKPEIKKIAIDYTISMQMLSPPNFNDPGKRTGSDSKNPNSDPFASPFNDKPFN
jgi:hypothetical protein